MMIYVAVVSHVLKTANQRYHTDLHILTFLFYYITYSLDYDLVLSADYVPCIYAF